MKLLLAVKLLWRDWRAGELTLLLASLVVAIGTVTTITLFVDRLQQALILESASFLAADRVISSSDPIPEKILQKADSLGLKQTRTLSFLSMVFAADRAQFSSVKAVTDGYPLRGTLAISDAAFIRGRLVDHGPEPGVLWLESRLLPALDIKLGDQLEVGQASFTVTQVLTKEPDRGGGFYSAGPRVMMNLADVEKTRVVQPGSRITYKYLFSGSGDQLAGFDAWLESELPEGSRVIGVKDSTRTIGNALSRAERFLLLGGLMGVILTGIAIAMSARRYSHRHYDHVAILKTLGATPQEIDRIFLVIFIALGCFASLLGTSIGWMLQFCISWLLEPLIPVKLPPPGLRPIGIGMVTGFVCLLAFALPPILRLRETEPVRVIRKDVQGSTLSNNLSYVYALAGIFGLMWWYSEDLRLTLLILGGAFGALSMLGSIAWLLLRSGGALGMQAGSVWRLALAGMQRRGQENTLQILVFGLAIMLLLILFLVRTALIEEWKSQIPENAPNHFMINISPQDVTPLEILLKDHGIESQPLYPMIRGRIARINGESAGDRDKKRRPDEPGPRAGSERNLTWSSELPEDNHIIEGAWWTDGYQGEPRVSVEAGLARTNGLTIGDELIFSIQGREVKARVASIRTVAWDNMKPNFFMIFTPGVLEDFSSTFMSSFHLKKERKLFLNTLLKAYPTITVIEVDAIIEQIQTIVSQVTMAVEIVLLLILASGAMVLLASVQASMDERLQQHAILRTLGAKRKLIMGSIVIEFCALGFFAGIVATLGAEVTVYGLQTQVFELEYRTHPVVWALGPVIGMVIIGMLGTFATRKVIYTPPITALREMG